MPSSETKRLGRESSEITNRNVRTSGLCARTDAKRRKSALMEPTEAEARFTSIAICLFGLSRQPQDLFGLVL